mgnify:CR=1 FL=1
MLDVVGSAVVAAACCTRRAPAEAIGCRVAAASTPRMSTLDATHTAIRRGRVENSTEGAQRASSGVWRATGKGVDGAGNHSWRSHAPPAAIDAPCSPEPTPRFRPSQRAGPGRDHSGPAVKSATRRRFESSLTNLDRSSSASPLSRNRQGSWPCASFPTLLVGLRRPQHKDLTCKSASGVGA